MRLGLSLPADPRSVQHGSDMKDAHVLADYGIKAQDSADAPWQGSGAPL